MSSNLPPGVTESMLPGNTPEDIAWDQWWEWTWNYVVNDNKLDVDEARRAIVVGVAAVIAERGEIADICRAAEHEGRMLQGMGIPEVNNDADDSAQ